MFLTSTLKRYQHAPECESVPYIGFSNLAALESPGWLKKKEKTPMLRHHPQECDFLYVEWGIVSFQRLPDDLNVYPGLIIAVLKYV